MPESKAEYDERERQALGALIESLLDDHWPESRVNGWHLADVLLERGVRYPAAGSEADLGVVSSPGQGSDGGAA